MHLRASIRQLLGKWRTFAEDRSIKVNHVYRKNENKRDTGYEKIKELERKVKGTKPRCEFEDLTENRRRIFKMVFTANVCTRIKLVLLAMDELDSHQATYSDRME